MNKLVLSLLIASVASPAVAFAAEPEGGTDQVAAPVETVEAVDVKLAIKAGRKNVGELAGLVAWDQPAELSMDVDGHQHVTSVTVHKSDDTGRKFKVELGYLLDGKTILDTIEIDAAAARKKIVKSADGSIAIAMTLAPKQVSADLLVPKKSDHHIDLPTDSTDPLAGLD